jgi:hypothetical protein
MRACFYLMFYAALGLACAWLADPATAQLSEAESLRARVNDADGRPAVTGRPLESSARDRDRLRHELGKHLKISSESMGCKYTGDDIVTPSQLRPLHAQASILVTVKHFG